MANSTCPKCSSNSFEMKEAKIRNSAYRLYFVQCASCGAVVGVQEFENIGALIYKLAKKMGINLNY